MHEECLTRHADVAAVCARCRSRRVALRGAGPEACRAAVEVVLALGRRIESCRVRSIRNEANRTSTEVRFVLGAATVCCSEGVPQRQDDATLFCRAPFKRPPRVDVERARALLASTGGELRLVGGGYAVYTVLLVAAHFVLERAEVRANDRAGVTLLCWVRQ